MEENAVRDYVDSLLACPKLGPLITCHRPIPAAPAEYGENRLPWPQAIANLLNGKGIRLFSHQALATDHIRAGHSIVAATPTASGKSMIYNLPALERHLRDPEARSLYLFPLKALAQDQLAAFRALCEPWPEDARPKAAIYDGDTSDYMRRKIRNDPPNALITNPEMLHLGIMPYHHNWATFLASLQYVIVDEAHTYRGVFGSHMAQVFRRLNRVCERYGAKPTYIFCTATLGNPDELAGRLMGRPDCPKPVLINKSGAPQSKRHFIFVNPDQAASTCAIDLLKRSLERGLRTIVYCQSRRMTELVSVWAGSEAGEWQNRISSYRAGYLPEERRDIEARMASGDLMAVVSTSALELGIDIGGLDVCILVGYPGTITQTLQRGGRVGRAGRESAVILVAGDDAMDQYFAKHPEDFFSRPPEKATVNPHNEIILKRHLECAAAELPLGINESWLKEPGATSAIASLESEGLLARSASGREWLAVRKRPQRNIDLRGSGMSYALEDESGQAIGLLDGFRAWKEAHPGAVYLHRGKSYIVNEIDSGRMRISLSRKNVGWFTRARSRKETAILEETGRRAFGDCVVFKGRLRISEQITGYERRAASGNKLLNIMPLDAPLQVFETEGFWFAIPDEIRAAMEAQFLHFMGSIHALEHAIIGLLPLEVMADRNDFGGISIPMHPQLGLPAVFIYDGLPGGAGLCQAAYERAPEILASTFKAISGCSCEDGCPSCIQSPKCGAGNRPLSKAGALDLLARLRAAGPHGLDICEKLKISPAPDFNEIDFPPAHMVQGSAETGATPAVVPENPASAPPSPTNAPSASPPARYMVFDVETRLSANEVGGWDKADKMGISVAVLYDSGEDKYFTYEQDALPAMFARMAKTDLLIGFNSFRFDYKALEPFANALESPLNLAALPGLDLLQRIYQRLNYRVSLDNLCRATLGAPKIADGLQALKWWKEGKIAEIAKYCQKDVELTKELYLFGLREKYLLFANKAGAKTRVPVDFSI